MNCCACGGTGEYGSGLIVDGVTHLKEMTMPCPFCRGEEAFSSKPTADTTAWSRIIDYVIPDMKRRNGSKS